MRGPAQVQCWRTKSRALIISHAQELSISTVVIDGNRITSEGISLHVAMASQDQKAQGE